MLLQEVYKHNRYLNKKRGSGLLLFEVKPLHDVEVQKNQKRQPKENAPKRVTCVTMLCREADKFSNQTTIHAMNKWCSMSFGTKERLFWLLAFITALLACIYVSTVIAKRYNRRTFHTVIDNANYPIYKIPFPEVTICNRNRLNWQRFEAASERFLHKQHRTPAYQAFFARILATYDNLTFGNFDNFKVLERESNTWLINLNYVNLSNVVDFMSWRCNEMFERCSWRGRPFDCCDIFLKRRSQYGQCLAFNTVEGDVGEQMLRLDPYWPWRNAKFGQKTGLSLRVLLNEKQHCPNKTHDKGITMMMGEPYVYFNEPFDITKNTQTRISVDAIMHFYDDQTKRVSSDKRQCVFEDEQGSADFKSLTGHKYMIENCQSECQQEYLMNFCNCTMDLFFPPAKYPACKLVDLPCLARYNHLMLFMEQPDEKNYVLTNQTGLLCKCLLNCYSLTYIMDVRSVKSREHTYNLTAPMTIDLDIFYVADFMLVFRTSLIYTWVDLIVSFGGIVGLFLGCSLMSLVELGYFLLIDIPTSMIKYRERVYRESVKRQKFQNNAKKVIY